jgi:hypothetical protein
LFDLPGEEVSSPETTELDEKPAEMLARIDATIDKIDAALPAVRGLDASDAEMDSLANKATESYDELMNLGMQVDSRYASEIFSVASQMLGHAITAKTAKLNKKIKVIELQLKKVKLDADLSTSGNAPSVQGQTLDRNELLIMIKSSHVKLSH